jgi:hypothetical protein
MSKTEDGSDRVLIADIDTETGMPCDHFDIPYDYRLDTARQVAIKHLNAHDIYVHGYIDVDDHYILLITDFSVDLNSTI